LDPEMARELEEPSIRGEEPHSRRRQPQDTDDIVEASG
jgi:hypothetical protein